jgi:hypothetical protein
VQGTLAHEGEAAGLVVGAEGLELVVGLAAGVVSVMVDMRSSSCQCSNRVIQAARRVAAARGGARPSSARQMLSQLLARADTLGVSRVAHLEAPERLIGMLGLAEQVEVQQMDADGRAEQP